MTTYITTPIYYVNAQPHLGHAYTTIVADVYSRFCRLCGDDVRFQTGTDEHGDKIAEAAIKEQVSPKEYVDRISALYRESWPQLHIIPDNFIRTTDAVHIETVQRVLQQVYDQGDIYFGEYTGLYCKGCERFLTEKELVNGNCPDHQRPPEAITEQNYFFRMSKYQQQLIDHIHANPEFITPERYKNEVLSFLSEPLEDLCISRPTSRLTWGIALPFDQNFVTYVWFDALINYLTGIGYPAGESFQKYWAAAEHVIAKDILKPHAIYWPTMLLAMGLPLFQRLHVHGYWNVGEIKMSKSIGNVVRPADLVAEYGVDTVRYFLLREMSFGLDASFSSGAIVTRKNSDLANDLGNLFSRSMAMLEKYTDSQVPVPGATEESDMILQETARQMLSQYHENMGRFQFHRALQSVWDLISHANKYIVVSEPWVLAKEPAQQQRLHTVLYNLVETLRLLTLVLRPVMPETAQKMAAGLGLDGDDPRISNFSQGAQWGLSSAGTRLQAIEPLFPRMDKPEKSGGAMAVTGTAAQKNSPKKEKKKGGGVDVGVIEFEQFQQIDLRVAEVVHAERIEKSDRLLKLTVKAPDTRTIVAGIAEYYTPGELLGRLVLIVANLKPVELMGVQSQGMVLAAKTEVEGKKRLVLATVSGLVTAGSKVA
ncbi:MAG: methionine--tRNA ligase [Proteobacteria bacterium]|jgi:methionyl-tRNA synthetase|nr:methionine--tRNA ligase [Desulfocapsa sp.]MBU3944143.1 methionine--tRNA ligase [Pseudomonadota bacterium]MBU3983236.1 methionine--tRNA ligase [Pseudomonadota bacterium]MBU4083069.1 methionine--tRNA ligase [Pseudomonadota bacterium]MBU4106197.1 methionine--tRNA ligase [Pseudomonadota bacterium]